MPQVTLRAKSNDGLVALSDAHPEAVFHVYGAWPTGDELRVLLETKTVDADYLAETLEEISEILDAEFRYADDTRILFEASTPIPDPHGAMAQSGIAPSFPLHLEDGWIVGDVVAPQAQISAFREELSTADIEHRISRVSSEPTDPNLLTSRQRDIVDAALDHGYYDVPRDCTLTELAEKLHVNKSVVSRVLHRAEGRIIADYRSEPGGPPE